MTDYSTALVLGAVVCYLIAMLSFAVDISALGGHAPQRKVRRAANIGLALSWLGVGLHLVGLVTRGLAAGRVPWANMYEFSLTFALVAMLGFLVINRKRDIRYLGVFVSFLAVAVLFVAFWHLFVEADGVQPILDSYWLVVHVSVAAGSTGVFSIAAAASALQLIQHRQSRRTAATKQPARVAAGSGGDVVEDAAVPPQPTTFVGRVMAHVPDVESLERFAYRLNAVAFVGWTLTLVAGAIWAEAAWGRPWGWDPKETWTLVIWLIYAAYLHVRATVGWTINRFAWFGLVGFVALLANFYVVNIFFPGNHSYSGL
ncbi:c-type cytochrome biogenesis protein CcsB [Pseudactinotalea sp.]|uniref:c-type cytochrome biogenesis protein CcsB n=1 Tax=Pseudactinotalea sp. TaxID=1926260 RepID=UPI003B3A6CB8